MRDLGMWKIKGACGKIRSQRPHIVQNDPLCTPSISLVPRCQDISGTTGTRRHWLFSVGHFFERHEIMSKPFQILVAVRDYENR